MKARSGRRTVHWKGEPMIHFNNKKYHPPSGITTFKTGDKVVIATYQGQLVVREKWSSETAERWECYTDG